MMPLHAESAEPLACRRRASAERTSALLLSAVWMAWARLHRSPGTVMGATRRLSTGVEGVKRTVSPTAGGGGVGGGCAARVAGCASTAARTSISVQLCFRFIPFSWVRFETVRASSWTLYIRRLEDVGFT